MSPSDAPSATTSATRDNALSAVASDDPASRGAAPPRRRLGPLVVSALLVGLLSIIAAALLIASVTMDRATPPEPSTIDRVGQREAGVGRDGSARGDDQTWSEGTFANGLMIELTNVRPAADGDGEPQVAGSDGRTKASRVVVDLLVGSRRSDPIHELAFDLLPSSSLAVVDVTFLQPGWKLEAPAGRGSTPGAPVRVAYSSAEPVEAGGGGDSGADLLLIATITVASDVADGRPARGTMRVDDIRVLPDVPILSSKPALVP